MIPRHLSRHILKYAKQYPLLALVGPRQSGKTTLSQALFPEFKYVSLENLDVRQYASEDPRGFLDEYGPHAILDEVQRVPELFPYLQEVVDRNPAPAQFILTGSAQFLLVEKIAQSLAGRIITFKLYPLTFLELFGYSEDPSYDAIFRVRHQGRERIDQNELLNLLFTGFFPRIHDRHLDSHKWYENYVMTYVERDIRSLLQVRNLRTFENFLRLCASQSGQLMNYSSLANSLGVALSTVKEWLSLLETSGLIFVLPPYFKNFSKRIVKTPKIYFTDPGLLCFLLSIRNVDQLKSHPLLGSIFETFIVSECFKRFFNIGETPSLYFWRDQTGNEIDLLIDDGGTGFPVEVKLSQTAVL
jgi:predicted AAA+ superfamily ATPase